MRRETVGDGGGDVAVLGEANGEGKIALAVAAAEAAAVDQDDTGMVAGGLGTDDVHAELIVGDGGEGNIAGDDDVVGDGEFRGKGAGGKEKDQAHGIACKDIANRLGDCLAWPPLGGGRERWWKPGQLINDH